MQWYLPLNPLQESAVSALLPRSRRLLSAGKGNQPVSFSSPVRDLLSSKKLRQKCEDQLYPDSGIDFMPPTSTAHFFSSFRSTPALYILATLPLLCLSAGSCHVTGSSSPFLFQCQQDTYMSRPSLVPPPGKRNPIIRMLHPLVTRPGFQNTVCCHGLFP